MKGGRDGRKGRHVDREIYVPDPEGSGYVFGAMWAMLWAGTLLAASPWAGYHGVLLAGAGLLMLLYPPVVALPRLWWIFAGIFVLAGAAAFLPVGWFTLPEWRHRLGALGLDTGSLVVIQVRQAAETFGLFAGILVGGLWLAGQRPSPDQVRRWALVFGVGVAVYAILARLVQALPQPGNPGGEIHFGFFPNRNHTATYLAMGAVCGLGNVLQALRDKRFLAMALALVATCVCLWAVAAWSMSRGGVVLVGIGGLVWLPMLGARYLGKHGLWAMGLLALAAAGLFLIAESGVKKRFGDTIDQAGTAIHQVGALPANQKKSTLDALHDLDLRLPIALDTLNLIRDFKWTGIGAGQFFYIFPQYRKLSAVANDSDSYHPESDWLWMAAEAGLPATLALAALVIAAFWKARAAVLGGRDRALRSACLVAAMLVPVHGLCDVPGHHISLAWSAALLFVLALQSPMPAALAIAPRPWPFRIVPICLLAAAAWLVLAQWGGAPPPSQTAASSALFEAKRLYQEDQVLQKAALAAGRPYQPAPAEDRIEKALGILAKVTPQAPLDRDLWRYQGFLAMNFDDKYALADHCFALDRMLDPTWVEGPLRQAQFWAPIDAQRCVDLWSESLRRAAQLDSLKPGGQWTKKQMLQRIRLIAKGKPELEILLPVEE